MGHAFSGESLPLAKEDELETALWTAVETCEELLLIHRELAARFREAGAPALAVRCERRSGRARKNVAALRRLIAGDGPALVGARERE